MQYPIVKPIQGIIWINGLRLKRSSFGEANLEIGGPGAAGSRFGVVWIIGEVGINMLLRCESLRYRAGQPAGANPATRPGADAACNPKRRHG